MLFKHRCEIHFKKTRTARKDHPKCGIAQDRINLFQICFEEFFHFVVRNHVSPVVIEVRFTLALLEFSFIFSLLLVPHPARNVVAMTAALIAIF